MFKRFWWVFLVTLVVGPLLGLLVGGVIAYMSPKMYESSATIQVRPPGPSVQILPGLNPSPPGSNFLATEFEVIRSQATLDRVIDELDLPNRWGVPRAEALEILRRTVAAQSIRGTDLIEIRVRTTNPNDAKAIAEAVTDAYRSRRAELERDRKERALDELRDAVRQQEDAVEEKRMVLTQLIRTGAVVYRPTPGGSPKDAAAKYAELEAEQIKLESLIESLLNYDGEPLITYAAGLDFPDNTVRQLHPQWLEAKRQLEAAKLAGLGDGHPTVRQQKHLIAELEKRLAEGVVDLREALRSQLERVNKQIYFLKTDMEEGKTQEPIPPDIARHEFDEAKADFETAQSLLEQLKIKLISEEMQRRLSEDPVVVHSKPVEAMKPVSPRVPLLLLLGTAGGLVLGLIAPLVLIPILHVVKK